MLKQLPSSLSMFSRKELQTLAKQNGIKANIKSDDLQFKLKHLFMLPMDTKMDTKMDIEAISQIVEETTVKPEQQSQVSVELNITHDHTIENCGFGNVPTEIVNKTYKDGRAFSHLIEPWLESNYPLQYIPGCKSYDFIDKNHPEILYDAKTFTKGGCSFCPSNMLGQGRVFDKEKFEEKTKKLIFCIVSNINFPDIKVKFIRGIDLIKLYPTGKIPLKDFIKFFN